VSLPSSLQSFSAGRSSRRVFVSSAGCASFDWWRYIFLREKVCVCSQGYRIVLAC
jgi:hypothetical protein